MSFIVPWGGAVAGIAEDDTPYTQRDATWVVHPYASWVDPADDGDAIGWARAFHDDIQRFSSGGAYLNFTAEDDGEHRVRAAFGAEKYERLAAIKARYDSENVFRVNQNIKPAKNGRTR